jgi:hypothetical protein
MAAMKPTSIPFYGMRNKVDMIIIMQRLSLDSCRIRINATLDSVVDLCDHRLPFCSQLRITLERLCRDSGAESVVIVQQQLQTGQYHRSQARAFESGLLLDQHLDVVWD